MEINPIARVRVVHTARQPKNDPQLSAVFDIENAFRAQQDTFAQNEGKMTGGQDDESTEQEGTTAEASAETAAADSGPTVNLFA